MERTDAVSLSVLQTETGSRRAASVGGWRATFSDLFTLSGGMGVSAGRLSGCGEEDHAKLPVYTAEELKHVRVEACDSCRTYIKTVDMTKSGLAEPIVDEMAAIPLDVWAREQGYTKLQSNLMQL